MLHGDVLYSDTRVGGKHLDAARLKDDRPGSRGQDLVLATAGAGILILSIQVHT